MKNTKKFVRLLVTVLVMTMLVGMVPTQATAYNSEELNTLNYQPVQNLGYPITNLQFIDCTFGTEIVEVNGVNETHNMVYTTATGKPALFVCYDLDAQKVVRELPLAEAKTVWSHGTDSQGNVYIATQSEASLFKYSPVTHELINLGKIFTPLPNRVKQTAMYGVSFDENDNVYVGTYPSGLIVKHSGVPGTSFSIVSNNVYPTESYVRAMTRVGGYMYVGGYASTSRLKRVSYTTGQVEELAEFVWTNEDGVSEGISGFMGMNRISDDYLSVCFSSTLSRYIMAIYKISTNEWLLGENYVKPTYGFYSGVDEGKAYIHSMTDGKLWMFNSADETMTNTNVKGTTNRHSKLIDFNTTAMPGKTLVSVLSNGDISYINLQKNTQTVIPSLASEQPIEVRSMLPGVANTNSVYVGSYLGAKMGILNDDTNYLTYPESQQIEGMCTIGNKAYFGTYPGGNVMEYDPLKPNEKGVNPKQLTTLSTSMQDRPFALCNANGKLAIGTAPDYGELGGALTIYDANAPVEQQFEVIRNIVPNQSIVGLAYKDGKIYGSTCIWGGLGAIPTTSSASVFIYDMATKQTTLTVQPTLANSPVAPLHIGSISFDSNGYLWGVSKGVVFKMDPTTLNVLTEIKVADSAWNVDNEMFSPLIIHWASNNVMITNAGNRLSAIDIQTSEIKPLYDGNISYMTVSEKGNVYFASLNRVTLYKLAKNAPEPTNGRIAYAGYGYANASFMTEKLAPSSAYRTKEITFEGISNDKNYSTRTKYGISGTYNNAVNFDLYPQKVELSNKDGKNTICVKMPHKGYQIILPLTAVRFDETYTKNMNYTFKAEAFVATATQATNANEINLNSTPPVIFGGNTMGAYIRFFRADGTVAGDSARAYAAQSTAWRNINISIPSTSIPADAVSMESYLYYGSGNATFETHIANPAFYVN